jgi:hypothetical protein
MAPTFTKLLEERAFEGEFTHKIPTPLMLKSKEKMQILLLRIKRATLVLQGDENLTLQHVIPVFIQLCTLSRADA